MKILKKIYAFVINAFHSLCVTSNKQNLIAQQKLYAFMDYDLHDPLQYFIKTYLPDFIPLACAHYNAQKKYLSLIGYYHMAKPYDVRLAADYFCRNRGRLLEWYCLHHGFKKLFTCEDMVNYDLYGFDEALVMKMKKHGIKVHPNNSDKNKAYGMTMLLKNNILNKRAIECLSEQLAYEKSHISLHVA